MSRTTSLLPRRLQAVLLGAATLVALGVALSAPAQSRAADCNAELVGASGSVWELSGGSGVFNAAFLPGEVGDSVLGEGVSGFMYSYVNLVDIYETPDDDACVFDRSKLNMAFPSMTGPSGIAVKPELHLDRKRPAGRQLVRLSNTTDHGVTFNFRWTGNFDVPRGELKVDRTSSGDRKVTKADGWITTCEDVGAPGCRKQAPVRSPELTVVWEGLEGPRDRANSVDLEGNSGNPFLDLRFNNIKLKPGQATYLMSWVVLNRGTKSARKFAARLAHEPDWAFAGISNAKRKLIRNW